jgi:hypothetical protein
MKPNRITKEQKAKRAERKGGGGASDASSANDDKHLDAQKFSTMAAAKAEIAKLRETIAAMNNNLVSLEEMCMERDKELKMLRKRVGRAERFPDDMYEMNWLVRRAPSHWHLITFIEVIIQSLAPDARPESVQMKPELPGRQIAYAAYETLGRIARKFRTFPKRMLPYWLSKSDALNHPAFLKPWNEPPPTRTRGGTGGNDSGKVLSVFVERTMIAYDKHVEWMNQHLPNGGPSIPERYSKPDEYLAGFLPFAKEKWEDGGREAWESFMGMQLRSNVGGAQKPKKSFGLFKKGPSGIEGRVRGFLESWRAAYPP